MNTFLHLAGRARILAGLGLAVALLSAGCSKPDEPGVEIARCALAGATLNEPFLSAASKNWLDRNPASVPANNRDLLIGGEKLQKEMAPDGTHTSARTVLDVADKWKRSEFCQKVVEEFKQEVVKMVAKAAAPQSDDKCDTLRFQLGVAGDAVLGAPKAQVLPGIVGTLNNSLANFFPEKQEYLKAEMTKDPEAFAYMIARSCSSVPKGELTNAINRSEFAQRFVSQRSKALKGPNVREVPNCGDLPEVYCQGEAVRLVASNLMPKSLACDKEITQVGDCDWTAEAVVADQVQQVERTALTKAKADLERFLRDPEGTEAGFRSRVNEIANRCRADAMYKGMRANELFNYANNTCLPGARQQLLAAKEQTLKKVIAKLEQMPAAKPAMPASATSSTK